MELYVDNDLVGSDSDWLCPMISIQFKKAKIGMATYNSEFFNGIIDEVKVFKIPEEPPNAPTITGPDRGKPGDNIEYKFNAVDPNGDQVKYIIDWGDNNTETTALNPSGVDVTVTHTWSEKGDYTIKVHAQDVNGLNGPESTKTITMPKNRAITWNSLLMKILEYFPFLEKILNLIL